MGRGQAQPGKLSGHLAACNLAPTAFRLPPSLPVAVAADPARSADVRKTTAQWVYKISQKSVAVGCLAGMCQTLCELHGSHPALRSDCLHCSSLYTGCRRSQLLAAPPAVCPKVAGCMLFQLQALTAHKGQYGKTLYCRELDIRTLAWR